MNNFTSICLILILASNLFAFHVQGKQIKNLERKFEWLERRINARRGKVD